MRQCDFRNPLDLSTTLVESATNYDGSNYFGLNSATYYANNDFRRLSRRFSAELLTTITGKKVIRVMMMKDLLYGLG